MGYLKSVLLEAEPPAAVVAGKRFYRPELDGLRFYAFLGVFVSHSLPFGAPLYRSLHLPLPWLWGALVKAGTGGVDLFFALSAYLITSLLLKERNETGEISLRRFYMRRILRIWPLYFLIIALGLVFAHTIPGQHLPWFYAVAYVFFIGNWIHAVFGRPESIAFPLWTVSIEEQFYLVWPVIVQRLERRGIIIAALITFAIATVFRVIFVITGVSNGYIYYGSTSRCDSLALGILLAIFADQIPRPKAAWRLTIMIVSIVAWVVASAWLTDQPGPISFREVPGRLMVSLAAGAMLYACLYSSSRLLVSNWVVRLGKVSYGLYLWHLTGILIAKAVIHPVSGMAQLAAKGAGFVVTVLLAFTSYRYLEAPFLKLKDRFATVLSRPV